MPSQRKYLRTLRVSRRSPVLVVEVLDVVGEQEIRAPPNNHHTLLQQLVTERQESQRGDTI